MNIKYQFFSLPNPAFSPLPSYKSVESHSLLHGRPFPLKGRYFANIFIHFEPSKFDRLCIPALVGSIYAVWLTHFSVL